MSQQDFNHNLDRAIDTLNDLIWNKQLLDIAIETSAIFTEQNFDRVSVLLENFQTTLDCNLEHLQWLLNTIKEGCDT